MSELHIAEFLALLKKSGLMSPLQWETAEGIAKSVRVTIKAESQENESAATATAAELVKQQLLTPWQAGQLLKGQTGFVLQQYRLLSPAGKGGMGHVFRARDERSGAIVAVKVMSRKLTGNQTLVNRFRREIRASSLLNSPYIVKTLDAGRVGKVDFMVMEYVNGDQLDSIVARVSVVPVPLACDVIRQAALGLQHAHEQKMVHRDIKPANLIVDWSADGLGTVKIMDMGLVRLGDDEHQTTVTKAGQVMGTPDYMSPEQGWDTATVDIRSDIYSLGCTFFRLLTGRVPFPGDNPLQVLMARCSKDAPSARSVRPDLPVAVDAVLRKMTLRDPAGRFQTPQELVDAMTPLSSPLTIEGLRAAIREACEDDAVLLELAAASETSDPQDAGYLQFLREMDSGAAVDLMMTTNPGSDQPLDRTLPILPDVGRHTIASRRPAAQRGRTAGFVALAAGSGLVSLLALFLFINRTQHEPPEPIAPVVRNSQTVPSETIQAPVSPVQATPVDEPVMTQYSLLQPEPEWLKPDDTLALTLVSAPLVADGTGIEFRLGTGAQKGMVLDPRTGEFLWTPTHDQRGQHEVTAELVESSTSRVVAETQLTLRVIAMPVFSEQRAQAGELLQIDLPNPPAGLPARLIRLRVAEGSPPDVMLDLQAGQIRWQIPADAAGRHEIRLRLDVGLPNRRPRPGIAASSVPESVIVVNVIAATPKSLVPAESEITAAETALRELFRKELAAAKAATDRAVLARLLMERCYDQTPGASDFALLDLAAEQADRGRAADVALEVSRIRAERYGTDELVAAKTVVAEFRPASLNPQQQDAAIEHCLRLALLAVSETQFADAAALLALPDVLLKKADRGSLAKLLADDVATARTLAEELSGDDSAVAEIQVQELTRILQRWQFADLFAAKESLGFVQASNGTKSLPDSGRSLWTFEEDRFRLESGSQPLGVGFLDPANEAGRYLIRMQLAARTTSAVLIFGAGPEQNLNAYMLTLDNSAFGRVSIVPGLATVTSPPPNTKLLNTGWNEIEILVDGPQVAVRLNGAAVLNTQVISLKPGRLGMLVSLERAVPAPYFDMRVPRILMLP